MAKPAGPLCNIACKYCFYLEKEALFEKGRMRMSEETLETFIRAYIRSQPANAAQITFAWQGGEPTLMGVEFFEKAVALQRQYGDGRRIDNALQTNGTRLDDRWGAFFKEHNFLIGLSVDGPEKLHDTYRVSRGGAGTFKDVMRGLEVLQKHGVEWNSLTCVNRANASRGEEVYRFLRGIGSQYMQFIPIVERKPDAEALAARLWLRGPGDGDERMMGWSVRPDAFGQFLCDIFDRWVQHDVGKRYVQAFDEALGKWMGNKGGLCVHNETCGDALAMEHDGSIYACDHYVYPGFERGKLGDEPLADIVDQPLQLKFGRDKRDSLPRQCRDCSYRFACNGGCPKHRFTQTRDGEPGLNYLCPGYYAFFDHVAPYMTVMARLLQQQQPPAMIMDLIASGQVPKPGRAK